MGARHALDADHLAAVSTLVADRRDWRASGWIGFWWGCGHTAMLLAVGLAVLLLNLTIPAALAQGFEFLVGAMLVALGGSLCAALIREGWHLHRHDHDGVAHVHWHSHRRGAAHQHSHEAPPARPLVVGMVHGLAGSAALMLLVVASIHSVWEGLAYIVVFGLGSIAGMVGVGLLIGYPLAATGASGPAARLVVRGLASLGSIGLGLTLMAKIAFG